MIIIIHFTIWIVLNKQADIQNTAATREHVPSFFKNNSFGVYRF